MNRHISLNGSDWLFKDFYGEDWRGSHLPGDFAGGETSAAVCAQLGINGMRVWKEIQPGLPSWVSLNDPSRMLVLKSGSFGKPDFYERALEDLKES